VKGILKFGDDFFLSVSSVVNLFYLVHSLPPKPPVRWVARR
jgi:hypothetical protein